MATTYPSERLHHEVELRRIPGKQHPNPWKSLMLEDGLSDDLRDGSPFGYQKKTMSKVKISPRSKNSAGRSIYEDNIQTFGRNRSNLPTPNARGRMKAKMTNNIDESKFVWQVFRYYKWVSYKPKISRKIEKVYGFIVPSDADVVDARYRANWWRNERNDMFVIHYKHYRISPLLMLQRNMSSGDMKEIRRLPAPRVRDAKSSYMHRRVMSSAQSRRSRVYKSSPRKPSRGYQRRFKRHNVAEYAKSGYRGLKMRGYMYANRRNMENIDIDQWNLYQGLDRHQSNATSATNNGASVSETSMALNFEDYRLWNTAAVVSWLRKLKLHQYSEIFRKNRVTGKILHRASRPYLTDILGMSIEDATNILGAVRVMKSGFIQAIDTDSFSSAGLFNFKEIRPLRKTANRFEVDDEKNLDEVDVLSESGMNSDSKMRHSRPAEYHREHDIRSQTTSVGSRSRHPPPFDKFKLRFESQNIYPNGASKFRGNFLERNTYDNVRHTRTYSSRPVCNTESSTDEQKRGFNIRRRMSAPLNRSVPEDDEDYMLDEEFCSEWDDEQPSLPEDEEIEPPYDLPYDDQTMSSSTRIIENDHMSHQQQPSSSRARSEMPQVQRINLGSGTHGHRREMSSAASPRGKLKWSSRSQLKPYHMRYSSKGIRSGISGGNDLALGNGKSHLSSNQSRKFINEKYTEGSGDDTNDIDVDYDDDSDDDDTEYDDDDYSTSAEGNGVSLQKQRREMQLNVSKKLQKYRELAKVESRSKSEDWQKASSTVSPVALTRHGSKWNSRYSKTSFVREPIKSRI